MLTGDGTITTARGIGTVMSGRIERSNTGYLRDRDHARVPRRAKRCAWKGRMVGRRKIGRYDWVALNLVRLRAQRHRGIGTTEIVTVEIGTMAIGVRRSAATIAQCQNAQGTATSREVQGLNTLRRLTMRRRSRHRRRCTPRLNISRQSISRSSMMLVPANATHKSTSATSRDARNLRATMSRTRTTSRTSGESPVVDRPITRI